MPKFYEMQNDELKEYLEMRVHTLEEFEGLVNWIVFRKEHPFISWFIQMFASFAYQRLAG